MDQLTELLAHLHTGAAAFEPASPMPDVGASTSHLRDAPSAERKVKVMPVVIACAVCAISDLNFSMLVPFFPEAAERHGCTPTVTGMLFGLHQAVALLVTPVAPFLCQRFGGAGVLRAACFLQARGHSIFIRLHRPGDHDDRLCGRVRFASRCAGSGCGALGGGCRRTLDAQRAFRTRRRRHRVVRGRARCGHHDWPVNRRRPRRGYWVRGSLFLRGARSGCLHST